MGKKTASELQEALKEINKTIKGEGLKLMSEDLHSDIPFFIPTGIPTLDAAIGGGLPVGRVVEIFGKQQAGKSTLAISACIQTQKLGGLVVYLDVENALAKARAEYLGLDLTQAVALEPSTMEEAYKYLQHLITKFGTSDDYPFILVVWDTLAFTLSETEVDEKGEIKADMGKRAQNIRRIMRRMIKLCANTNVCFLSLNHITEKIGGFVTPGAYEVPGGSAFKYGASVQVLLRPDNSKKIMTDDEEDQVGVHVKFRIEKTRLSPPKREVYGRLNFYSGFDPAGSVLDYLIESGLAVKEGVKYNIPVPESMGSVVQISTGAVGDKKFHELWDSSQELQDFLTNLVKSDYDAIIPWKNQTTAPAVETEATKKKTKSKVTA